MPHIETEASLLWIRLLIFIRVHRVRATVFCISTDLVKLWTVKYSIASNTKPKETEEVLGATNNETKENFTPCMKRSSGSRMKG
jgi:hypothetical protein